MANEEDTLTRVAILTERRLATMEAQLATLIATTTRLDEKVGVQNGRVAKAEVAILQMQQGVEDHETYIETPRWARMDSIGSQVEKLWEERVQRVNATTRLDTEVEEKRRWWSGFKLRLETVLALLGIAGGVYTLVSRAI